MKDFQGVKCPKCGKKGLRYAAHPHALGWKDYDRIGCRYCGVKISAEKFDAMQRASKEVAKAAGREGV